jgi:hypothetical protein
LRHRHTGEPRLRRAHWCAASPFGAWHQGRACGVLAGRGGQDEQCMNSSGALLFFFCLLGCRDYPRGAWLRPIKKGEAVGALNRVLRTTTPRALPAASRGGLAVTRPPPPPPPRPPARGPPPPARPARPRHSEPAPAFCWESAGGCRSQNTIERASCLALLDWALSRATAAASKKAMPPLACMHFSSCPPLSANTPHARATPQMAMQHNARGAASPVCLCHNALGPGPTLGICGS